MKAVLRKEYGPPENLVVEEVESQPLGKDEVRIAVRASGVNFPDTLIIQGQYQFKPDLPFAPGAEAAGDVTEVGAGGSRFKVGDRVAWYSVCGGFADEIVADQIQVTKIADSMDYKTAAGMFLTYGTSYHALVQRANIQPEETLLVLGAAGSVSLSAVDIRTALGAKVIAAAFSDDKLELAKQYGAELTINYSTEDLKARTKELTGGKGADVIYDPVGGDLFKQSLRAIARKGRMLVVGFASGEIPKLPVNLVLLKDCQVVGVFWGQFMRLEPDVNAQNVEDLVRMFEEGKIRPLISETYPLEKAAQALEDMLARKVKGKVVLTPDSG